MGHISVLLHESIDALNLEPGMTIVDGTLGGGGHACEILKRILPNGRLVGVDKDEAAYGRTLERMPECSGHLLFAHDDFKNIKQILRNLSIEQVDGAILDLGVSSFQLDESDRGFSYHQDARLDMRMDRTQALSAYEVVNTYPEDKLAEIISGYGEERWARRIAQFIALRREQTPIVTTAELTDVIKAAVPKGARQGGPHPARRTFQAIRIEVNGELTGLKEAIYDFADVIRPGGRIAVITFHSLEDRIVKQAFATLKNPCTCPPDAPVCVCGKQPKAKLVFRKPVLPSELELTQNPRARSAKLRVAEII